MKPEIYYFEACPYCKSVKDFIEKNSIQNKVSLKDVRKNKEYYDKLVEITQNDQVPCLVYRGEILFNSKEIIEWISSHVTQR